MLEPSQPKANTYLQVGVTSAHLVNLTPGDNLFDKITERTPAFMGFILAIYTAVITLMVGGLASYHWSIIMSATTTNEELKDVWARKPNPYDKVAYPPYGFIFLFTTLAFM